MEWFIFMGFFWDRNRASCQKKVGRNKKAAALYLTNPFANMISRLAFIMSSHN
jgi:hypothetical protein